MFRSRRQKSLGEKLRDHVWPRMGLARLWHLTLLRLHRIRVSDHQIALGFAAGAFVAFSPLLGFHFILAALIALVIRGNVLAAALGTMVGNPITLPFLFLADYNLGATLLGRPRLGNLAIAVPEEGGVLLHEGPMGMVHAMMKALGPYFLPMTIGSIPLGLISAVVSYKLVRMGLLSLHHRRERRRLARQNSQTL